MYTYFHSEVFETSKPIDEIEFTGHSLPHFQEFSDMLSKTINIKNNLPLRKESIEEYKYVHSDDYINSIIKASNEEEVNLPTSGECSGLEYAIPGYEYSLGGLYSAVDLCKKAVSRVFCSSLPGHHAYSDHGHGYCLLNPMAVAVRYAQSVGFKNILIIDWDFHHGDGTQTIFENDSTVYQISIHNAVDLYMSFMRVHEKGWTDYAQKVGHCSIPVMDSIYDDVFLSEVGFKGNYYTSKNCLYQFETEINNLSFDPDLIFIFSGFDAHRDDCGKNVTDWEKEDYRKLTKVVIDKAIEENCSIISTTGGGYNHQSNLDAAFHHIETLKG